MGWTVRCGRPPLLLPRAVGSWEFRLSALMDSDLAWVNGKSGRQSRHFPAFYNIGSHLPFTVLSTVALMLQFCVCLSSSPSGTYVLWLNGASYSKSYYWQIIGSRRPIWGIDWYQNQWPWLLFRGRLGHVNHCVTFPVEYLGNRYR